MKLVVIITAIGLSVAAPVYAQQTATSASSVAPSAVVWVGGNWQFPSAKDEFAAYPEIARRMRVTGLVTIDYLIAADGTMASCDVLSETPKGYDFGKQTVALFLKHARVDLASLPGGLQPNSHKKFTYKWEWM